MNLIAERLRRLSVSAAAVLVTGCVVAVGATAVSGGIYYTKRGAETTVAVPIGRVFWASERTFVEMGIRQTEAKLKHGDHDDEEEEKKGELEGKRADLKVKVTLKAAGRGSTRVRVVAERKDFGWDKDFARSVVARIIVLAQ